MLSSHSASTSLSRIVEDESQLEDFQCLLEVLQALTVTPSITDAAIDPSSPLKVCPAPITPHCICMEDVHKNQNMRHIAWMDISCCVSL